MLKGLLCMRKIIESPVRSITYFEYLLLYWYTLCIIRGMHNIHIVYNVYIMHAALITYSVPATCNFRPLSQLSLSTQSKIADRLIISFLDEVCKLCIIYCLYYICILFNLYLTVLLHSILRFLYFILMM